MRNLPPNTVLVVDNAAYHNKQWDLAPTSNSKKADMQAWLIEKGIQYEETLLKPHLYNLIKANKERFKTFSIDRILAEQGHQVLRLPLYHPDLNPIEMAWSDI
ncbi:jg7735 [Pararge aegeria aegeria]|uniref:Jg7735 protein n=1 Tax=Pararge aegeria aegeria TaxID=348720 RepID=A0A8S4RMB0_9NEOP|nr:jg7735 [Pararge aegeria aegeria]